MLCDKHRVAPERSLLAVVRDIRWRKAAGDEIPGMIEHCG